MESLFVEPFSIISNRYIEILLAKLAYPGSKFPITIDESNTVSKGNVVKAYSGLMPKFEIQDQEKQQ